MSWNLSLQLNNLYAAVKALQATAISNPVAANLQINATPAVTTYGILDCASIRANRTSTTLILANYAGTPTLTLNANNTSTFAADITVNGITVGRGNNASVNSNTAVGLNALFSTGGSSQHLTAVGIGTLQSASTTTFTTGLGSGAFPNLTAGSSNIGIGYNAGADLVSGSLNTYIGNTTASSALALYETVISNGSGAVGGNTGKGNNTTLITGSIAYLPPYIVQNTGSTITLGDATTTTGVIVPYGDVSVSSTGKVNTNTVASLASTKLSLNSLETNGTIELQKSGVKTGDILYANASFPLQLKSTAGISLDTLSNGNINIAPDGSGFNQLISTSSTGGTNVVLSGVACAQFKADTTGASPILLIQGLTTNTNHSGIQVINACNDFQNSIRLTAGPGFASPATNLFHMEFSNNGVPGGNITQNASTGLMTYGGASDSRLKKNINYDFDALNIIGQLKPATFSMKNDTQDTLLFGFIAQDVLPIYPQYIITGQDGMYQMDYSHFTGLLCKAIQQQQTKINSLEAQLASLKAVVDALVAQKDLLVV